jgi:hypothetical protein
MTEIFIYFTKNGVPRSKRVKARPVAPGQYVIEEQPYNRTTEKWKFEPGTKVKCDTVIVGGVALLFASERID